MIVPLEVAEKVWAVVVEHYGAYDEEDRRWFLHFAVRGVWTEYRFQWSFGLGGHVWHQAGRFYVTCRREDSTPEREAAMAIANAHLAVVYSEWQDSLAETPSG